MITETNAILFLLLAATVPVVWLALIVQRLNRNGFKPIQIVLFILNYLLSRLFWGTVVRKPLKLPPGQGAVVVSNHSSSVDPFFIQLRAGRPVYWMVSREYFADPVFGTFLRACGAIPVGRGGVDTAATKIAIRSVANGGYVGMFPEGRINMTEELLLPARPGAIMVALKGRVPIVPCYIEGAPFAGTPTSPFRMPARVKVQFGEPIDLSEYFDCKIEQTLRRQITKQCMAQIASLAGQPDYQVRLAGRNWKPSTKEVEADIAALRQRNRQRSS